MVADVRSERHMKFSEQLEARYADMITHYPAKRSLLVPFLLYVQDEFGYVTDASIEEIAQRLEITALEVRNVISYYSMLRVKPAGKPVQPAALGSEANIQVPRELTLLPAEDESESNVPAPPSADESS